MINTRITRIDSLLELSLRYPVKESLGLSCRGSLKYPLWASLWDSLGGPLEDSLWSSLWSSLRNTIRREYDQNK